MTDRTLSDAAGLDGLTFDERGLLPVVAQDDRSGQVLMVAWANREALERTLDTGEAHFWSRSRRALWRKGETSGNVLEVRSLHADCDGDTVLARVDPTGPACHTGEATCFGEGSGGEGSGREGSGGEGSGREGSAREGDPLDALEAVLAARARELPEGSYTTRLLTDENLRLKKLGEEAAELILATTKGEPDRVTEEAADLVYHLLVALRAAGSSLDAVRRELARRRS